MGAQLKQRIKNHESRLAIGKGDVYGPDGTPMSFEIVYDKEKVSTEDLSTYEDLTNEKWNKKVLIRSSGNIYNQSLVASMIEADGVEKTEAWARGLVANFARKPAGGDTDQLRAAAAGGAGCTGSA